MLACDIILYQAPSLAVLDLVGTTSLSNHERNWQASKMTKPKKILFNPIHLITDQPIDDLENDNLGLMPWAKMIAGAAVGTRGPFTIGVHGEWGYGKSTLLKLAKKLIETHYDNNKDEDVVTVWFNAWQFEREKHPLFPLIAAITDEIEKKAAANDKLAGLRDIGTSLRALTRGMKFSGEVGMPLFGKVGVEFDAEKALRAEELIGKQTNPLQGEMIYHSAFSTLEDITQKEEKAKIVVFVDDLDRCHPDKAVFLLESIKLILAQPGFVFAIAVDRRVIESYLERRYVKYCGEKECNLGRFYLEKIIQLPIYIPSHRSRFEEYVQCIVNDLSQKYVDSELIKALQSVQNVLAAGAGTNPRSLIRLVNNFILDCSLWPFIPREGSEYEKFQNLDSRVAMALVFNRILHQLLGDAYKFLVHDKELCDAILANKLMDYINVNTGDPDSVRRFEMLGQQPEEYVSRSNIINTLQSQSDILKALQSHGNVWLRNQDLRIAVYEFAQTQRADNNIIDLPEALAFDVRRALSLQPDEPIPVNRFADIRKLELSSSQITDAGLVHLKSLQQLQTLFLLSQKITDAGLVHLKSLQQLQELILLSPEITDAGLVHLKSLQQLQELFLGSPQIMDAGLVHFKSLQQLQKLSLVCSQITDAGLVHFKSLQQLQKLSLSCPQITDAGLVHLKSLQQLQELSLFSSEIMGAGLVHLKSLQQLQELSLGSSQITDAGLVHLKSLQQLQTLSLFCPQITDAGLVHLKSLQQLQTLFLSNTQITDVGVEMLSHAIQGINIVHL